MMEICPVCYKREYQEFEGIYEDFKKLTPDQGRCAACGFYYEEHIKYPIEFQIKKYKKILKEKK